MAKQDLQQKTYHEVETITDADGPFVIITQHRQRGTLTFSLSRRFMDESQQWQRSSFSQEALLPASLRVLGLAGERMRELRLKGYPGNGLIMPVPSLQEAHWSDVDAAAQQLAQAVSEGDPARVLSVVVGMPRHLMEAMRVRLASASARM